MKENIIRIKYFIKEKISFFSGIKYNKDIEKTNKKRVFVCLAADYGNIGDIAITYAQKKFIENILPEYEIIEIPTFECNKFLYSLKKIIKKDDIITLIGGGNMTNRYELIEEIRRRVIKCFRKNQIISFPQTIEFTEDYKGKESLRRTIKVYSKHPNLTIFARENKSFLEMKRIFKNNDVFLVPDIVMSLKNMNQKENKRKMKIGLCMRDDKEKSIEVDIFKEILKNYSKNDINILSTYIEYEKFDYTQREQYFKELLDKIMDTKVFVTDRLHGMIFCYLTKTPCIIFDNDNHKISETYNLWLKDCNYIKLMKEEEVEDLEKYIEDFSKMTDKYDCDLVDKYEELKNRLVEGK